ncbi:MAG: hypothetical protein KDG89_05095 [Geminicoccaceae bacterium]|nr:hypothetical protein [Geminicoccaceae bacterium]
MRADDAEHLSYDEGPHDLPAEDRARLTAMAAKIVGDEAVAGLLVAETWTRMQADGCDMASPADSDRVHGAVRQRVHDALRAAGGDPEELARRVLGGRRAVGAPAERADGAEAPAPPPRQDGGQDVPRQDQEGDRDQGLPDPFRVVPRRPARRPTPDETAERPRRGRFLLAGGLAALVLLGLGGGFFVWRDAGEAQVAAVPPRTPPPKAATSIEDLALQLLDGLGPPAKERTAPPAPAPAPPEKAAMEEPPAAVPSADIAADIAADIVGDIPRNGPAEVPPAGPIVPRAKPIGRAAPSRPAAPAAPLEQFAANDSDEAAAEATGSDAALVAPPTVEPAAPADAAGPRVFLHYDERSPAARDAAQQLAGRIWRGTAADVVLRGVGLTIGTGSVRYFAAADEKRGQDLLRTLKEDVPDRTWRLADFTDFRPSPSPGTIEVWLPTPAGSRG